MRRMMTAAVTAIGMAATGAAGAADAPTGRAWPAINGTTIRCPVPPPPTAEHMQRQFETHPGDLDAMSAMAKRFMDPNSPEGAGFRAAQAEQRATDWPFLCRYRDANAALKETGKRPRVVFMGDSITEQWGQADPAFFTAHDYVDRGISGQSSGQMLLRFYPDVVNLRPQTVHILAGTNDIGGATGPITEDETVDNIRAMIDLAEKNGIRVVLAALPPMSRLLPRPEWNLRPVVRSLNARLKALAAERKITFVDYYTPLALADGAFDPAYANDGVHPTRAGYKVMEPIAERALSGK